MESLEEPDGRGDSGRRRHNGGVLSTEGDGPYEEISEVRGGQAFDIRMVDPEDGTEWDLSKKEV